MNSVQAVAEVLGCVVSELRCERVKRGLTNESWRVRGCGHDVVVRLSTADEHALQIDRRSEVLVLRLVEQAGIGPQVVHCAPESHLLITRTLPGRDWEERDTREPRNVARLAEVLRRLHALPVTEDIRRIELARVLQGYWSELANKREFTHDARRHEQALHLAQALNAQAQRCLCHTDLHHFNIIDAGERLWILDWEYAGVGDLYFDLASVCCWHHYDTALRRLLLEEYFGEVGERHLLRLEQACRLFDYIKELWFAVRAMQGGM